MTLEQKQEKYILTIRNSGVSYSIPKSNIRFLAFVKAQDLKKEIELKTEQQAIDFFNSIGIDVEEM